MNTVRTRFAANLAARTSLAIVAAAVLVSATFLADPVNAAPGDAFPPADPVVFATNPRNE
jgi:hypothetical protein